MNKTNKTNSIFTIASIASFIFLWLGSIIGAKAQIIPDRTLPNNSVVTSSNDTFTIEGGTTAGGNLFHSFGQFSVPAGSTALFNNALGIDNIITRVTGERVSNIDGLLRASGSANVFFINPNGIAFGPEASLDIGGSFVASSAESLVFADGSTFSTLSHASSLPLLTVSTPVGLQLGANPGTIRVVGIGHDLISTNSTRFSENTSPALIAASNRTLALVGGEVDLEGGIVSAPSGRIELGGAADTTVGFVPVPEGLTLAYEENANFQPIRFSQMALADVRGTGGAIRVRGQSLHLADGSILLVQNEGARSGGSIDASVTDTIEVSGFALNPIGNIEPTSIILFVAGDGDGESIDLSARSIFLENSGRIAALAAGNGNGGDVNITAAEEVRVASSFDPSVETSIGVNTFGPGGGGNLYIATQRAIVEDGSSIQAFTTASGSGGSITIDASESVEFTGILPNSTVQGGAIASTTGSGNAGSIEINAQRVAIRDGAIISGSTLAEGDAASVVVNASQSVEISDSSSGLRSAISSSTIVLNPFLRQLFGLPDVPTGNANSASIRTETLTIDGANLTVIAAGPGDAGTLAVEADNIRLDNAGLIAASTVSGEGGNIALNASNSLSLRRLSQVSATAGGAGNGGNVTIGTSTIALLENSNITANAIAGNGGNIEIATQGIFASPESSITASSQFGADGIVEVTNPDINTDAGLVELSDRVANPADSIATGCLADEGSSFTRTGRGALPEDPTQPLLDRALWQDWDDYSNSSNSNTTIISTQSVPISEETADRPLIEASTWQIDADGTVALLAEEVRSPDLANSTSCGSHISQR